MVSRTRSDVALAVFLLATSLSHGPLLAQAQAPPPAQRETFSAKTINLAVGAGLDLKMDVFGWSADDERQVLLAALKDKGDTGLADALEKLKSLGAIWTNESLGYTIRYAYRDTLSGGSDRVILIIDRRLGSWTGQIWKPSGSSEAPDYRFSLIELHLNRTGAGEGKMSLTTKVAMDESGKTVALADYNAAPVVLRPVKHEPERQK